MRVGSSALFGAARWQFPAFGFPLCQSPLDAGVPSQARGVTRAALCCAREHGSQGTARLFYVSPASRGVQNSALDFLRHLNYDKEGRWIEVIFS